MTNKFGGINNGPRATRDERPATKKMQNEPNLTINELNHLHNKDLRSVERPATNKRRLCRPQPPIYAIRYTRYEIIYAKQSQSQNFNNRVSRIERQKNAKRTQFTPTSDERPATNKRRPCWPQLARDERQATNNMQNEPNFTHNFSNILTRIMRLLQLFTGIRHTFDQKTQKMHNFCNSAWFKSG